MPFSPRLQERRRERQEQLRQAALERRAEEGQDREREEQRREIALVEAKERDGEWEAARARREALLRAARDRLRDERQAQESHVAKRKQQHETSLAVVRSANLQARRADDKHAATQKELAEQERLEHKRTAQQLARRTESRRENEWQHRQLDQAAGQRKEQREAALEGRLAEHRQARQGSDQTEARRERVRQARLEERHKARQIETQRESARAASSAEQREAAREAEQAQARRESVLQVRRDEQRRAKAGAERTEAQRTARRDASVRATPPATHSTATQNPLEDRIPSGSLSGVLPWLRVAGNRIINGSGDQITLRGISVLGLDGAEPDMERGFAAGADLTEQTLGAAINWGANVLRIAINRSRILSGYAGRHAWDYLADLDAIIERAAAAGAYTMLSLRRLDDFTVFGTLAGAQGQRLPNFIAPQPDYDTIGMWRILGERYADEPAVLFDLYTAPHAPLPDDVSGYASDWDLWTLWVQMIAADLRRMHPRALLLVSGLSGGTDLSGFPILGTEGTPIPNLVYTAHLYPHQDNPWPAIRSLARTRPVFVTEWGGRRADVFWGQQMALALAAAGIGWTAAHWNAEPFLAEVQRGQIVPTAFGGVVRRALALSQGPRGGLSEGSFRTINNQLTM